MDPGRGSRAASGCALAAALAACALLVAETVGPWSRNTSALAPRAGGGLWWVLLSLTGIAVAIAVGVGVGLAFWRGRAARVGEQTRDRLEQGDARDVFHRPSQDSAAQRRGDRLQRFTQEAPIGVAVCSDDGQVEFANDEYLRIIGWQREEFEQACAAARRRAVLGCLGTAPGSRQEKEYVRRDGARVPVRIGLSSQRDGLAAFVVDRTAEKRTQEALRESEDRFNALADNIPQLAWTLDERGRITWFNKRWLEYLGFTPEELIAQGRLQTIHPDHMERALEQGARSFLAGEVWEDTFPLLGKDGRYRWFLSRAVPIRDEKGVVVKWFGTATDVTEQREAQEELKEADRRKNEFLGVLSHELRNPLAPIRYSLHFLEQSDPGGEQALRAREIIGRQVDHLARLVDDLLDLTRIARGKIEIRRARLALDQVVRRCAEDLRPIFVEAGLALRVTVPGDAAWVDGDAARLSQVVSNLLHNALKFSPEGGLVSLSLAAEAGWAEIRVTDEGAGIEPAMLERVFDPFVQSERTRAQSRGGLGLGLALVKGLVEAHGGTVRASSAGLGRGTEFVVRLPTAPPGERTDEATEPAAPGRGRRRSRVLVVEDNREVAESLGRLVRLLGHEVEIVHDGSAAIARAHSNPPDIVLCDLGLPEMSGYDLARAFRADPTLRGVELVALSGYAQPEDRRASREAGFARHLAKPANPVELEQLLGA